jgi:hypothetical protein
LNELQATLLALRLKYRSVGLETRVHSDGVGLRVAQDKRSVERKVVYREPQDDYLEAIIRTVEEMAVTLSKMS